MPFVLIGGKSNNDRLDKIEKKSFRVSQSLNFINKT